MPQGLKKLLEPFLALSPGKRLVVGGVALVSLLAFAALITVANRVDYRPLFSNLNAEDAGEITKKLKEQKVPYQISNDGKAILVPSDKVYDLRLSLASDGLPQGGGVGFEIFDRKNFGMTEFVQKLNYQRALQGELSRTISQIAGVESARVHLAIPEKSLFKDNEKPTTASVVLKMKGGRTLRDSEVQGIVHLVASSVEGMDPDHVTVLDSRGISLSKNSGSDPESKLSGSRQEAQRAFEKSEEDKLQSLLDKVVGSGRSVARISATFDYKQVERFEERYDPDNSAVRSEQRTEEKGGSTTTASGVPGVQSNMNRAPAPSSTSGGGMKSDETMNYEVSRSTARTIEPVGQLAKVSVAVLVDGKYAVPAGAKPGTQPKYQPLSPDEMQKIDALVKSAVGFNQERGDQVTVQNIAFQDTGENAAEADPWYNAPVAQSGIKYGLIALGFLALLFMVIRPLMRILKPEELEVEEPILIEQDAARLEAQRAEIAQRKTNQLELIEKAKADPYQVAQILQNWLVQKD